MNKLPINILGFEITTSLDDLNIVDNYIINTINPHSYCLSRHDKLFNEALQSSDILLPDGTGIVLASRLLNNQSITKIAGADIHQYLLRQAHLKSQKVFYLGASQSTLLIIEE